MDKIRPFRFWCQKVLPLVYDNSLSYYELLCKVVDYLNNLGADVNTLIQLVTDMESIDLQEFVDNKLDEMAEDGTLDSLLAQYVKNYTKMLMCVSTYRQDISGDPRDYCLAISTDGGRTYSEIRASDDFADFGLNSDCSIAKVAGGYVFLATGASPSREKDFNMAFTKDFVTWETFEPNYGFLSLAQTMCADTYPMVGTPMLIEDNGINYLMLSLPTATSVNQENIYGYTETYRQMALYACEVSCSYEADSGFHMVKTGDIFKIKIDGRTNYMDGHAVKLGNKLYLFYKDRYDLTVNIAKADHITDTFQDVEKCVFDEVYLEACYMTKISETEALLNCTSYMNRQTTNLLGVFNSDTERVIYIGESVRSNCHHFYTNYSRGNSIDCGMRNPYPIVVDSDLYMLLKEQYTLPVDMPTITEIPFQYTASPQNTLPQRASKYIYDTYGKYMRLFPWVYYYIGSDTDNLYILNDFECLIGASLSPTFVFPGGSRTIRTGTTGERMRAVKNSITSASTLFNQYYELLTSRLNMQVMQNIYNTSVTFKGIVTADIEDGDVIGTKPDFLGASFWMVIPVATYEGVVLGSIDITEGGNIVYHGDTIQADTRVYASGTQVTR